MASYAACITKYCWYHRRISIQYLFYHIIQNIYRHSTEWYWFQLSSHRQQRYTSGLYRNKTVSNWRNKGRRNCYWMYRQSYTLVVIKKRQMYDDWNNILYRSRRYYLSPTKIVQQHATIYQGFKIIVDMDNGTGVLKLLNIDDNQHVTYPMTLKNGLWYH